MHPQYSIPAALETLAAAQGGVLTSEQCGAFGLSRWAVDRFVRQGVWQRLASGIYLTHNATPPWLALAWGGVLAGGDHALLAGFAAGHLWKMIKEPPQLIQVRVPHRASGRAQGPWLLTRTRRLPKGYGDPPRMPLVATVLELCALEPEKAFTWIDEALRNPNASPKAIAAALENHPRLPHRKLIKAVMSDHAEGINSELERAYARNVERAHGLPTGARQSRGLRYRTDVDYDVLIIELDGRLGHDGFGRFRDMERDNYHLFRGKPTLRYGWHDCTMNACMVARQVGRALTERGWLGLMTSCPNCRLVPIIDGFAA